MAIPSTLEAIAVAVDQLQASVDRRFDAQDRQLADIKEHLEQLNGRTREAERNIVVLQEQSHTRTQWLVGLQLIIGAVATWLGVSR